MGEKRTRDLRQFQCSTRLCELCFASKYEQAEISVTQELERPPERFGNMELHHAHLQRTLAKLLWLIANCVGPIQNLKCSLARSIDLKANGMWECVTLDDFSWPKTSDA